MYKLNEHHPWCQMKIVTTLHFRLLYLNRNIIRIQTLQRMVLLKLCYSKANFVKMYELVRNKSWNELDNIQDSNKAAEYFQFFMDEVIKSTVPNSRRNVRAKYPPWLNRDIIHYLKAKERAWRKYKKENTQENLENYRCLRSVFKQSMKATQKAYEASLEHNLIKRPETFWQYMKSKKKEVSENDIKMFNGEIQDTPLTIVNAFGKHFSSVYVTDSEGSGELRETNTSSNSQSISLTQITGAEVT